MWPSFFILLHCLFSSSSFSTCHGRTCTQHCSGHWGAKGLPLGFFATHRIIENLVFLELVAGSSCSVALLPTRLIIEICARVERTQRTAWLAYVVITLLVDHNSTCLLPLPIRSLLSIEFEATTGLPLTICARFDWLRRSSKDAATRLLLRPTVVRLVVIRLAHQLRQVQGLIHEFDSFDALRW